jgi:vacuolar-type H+-ATPase subunit H
VGLLGDIVDAVEDAADTVGDAVEDAVEDAIDAVEDAAEAVGEFAEDAVDALGDLAEDALEELGELGEDALDAAGDVYEAFEDLAEAAWDGATDLAEDAWDTISDAAEEVWDDIAEAAEDAWDTVADAAEEAWEDITRAAEELWEEASDAVESAWEAAVNVVEHVFEAASAMYEWALDAAERALAWLGDLIKDIAHAIAMLGACLAGIIVHNLAEADNILMNFWKTPRRLSSSFQDEVRDLFPNIPLHDVWYLEDAALSANHFSKQADAMTFMNPEVAGINLGYMIYIDGAFDETVEKDRGLMVHELVHVEQYRKFRFEDAFACAYGVGYADAGFSYEENPIEAEAFAVQGAYLAAE